MNDKTYQPDKCVICKCSFEHTGRHAIEYPVALRDEFVCDDCASSHHIVCQCCHAGYSMDEIIGKSSKRPEAGKERFYTRSEIGSVKA